MVMKNGAEAGFGKGMLSGALMNWRSVINVLGPLIVGQGYTYGRSKGRPGLVFLVMAGMLIRMFNFVEIN